MRNDRYHKGAFNDGLSEIWIPKHRIREISDKIIERNPTVKESSENAGMHKKALLYNYGLSMRRLMEFLLLLEEVNPVDELEGRGEKFLEQKLKEAGHSVTKIFEEPTLKELFLRMTKLNAAYFLGFTALESLANFLSTYLLCLHYYSNHKELLSRELGDRSPHLIFSLEEYDLLYFEEKYEEMKRSKKEKGKDGQIVGKLKKIEKYLNNEQSYFCYEKIKRLVGLRNNLIHPKTRKQIKGEMVIFCTELRIAYEDTIELANEYKKYIRALLNSDKMRPEDAELKDHLGVHLEIMSQMKKSYRKGLHLGLE